MSDWVKKAKIKQEGRYEGEGRPKNQGNAFYNNKESPSPIRNKTYNIFHVCVYVCVNEKNRINEF